MGLTPIPILEHRLTRVNGAVRQLGCHMISTCRLEYSSGGSQRRLRWIVAVEVIEHVENPRMIRGDMENSNPSRNNNPHYAALLHKDFTRIFGDSGFLVLEFHVTNDGGIPESRVCVSVCFAA
jgi:hypothetical protein